MKSFLYLAEDIQPMLNGKALAVGLFPDHVVVVHVHDMRASKENPVGVNLAFLVCVTDVKPGEYAVRLAIAAPDGTPTKYKVDTKQTVIPGGSITVAIRCQPFLFTEAGHYTVRTTVNDEMLESTFEVRFGEAKQSESA
jgi:hypothetical protein